MAQVLITDTKLNSLAQRIAAKSSAALPLTIDQMISIADSMTTGSGTINLQSKTVSPTTDTQTVVADISYDGLSSVVINPIQTMTSSVTANGTYIPTAGKYFSSISVNVPIGTTINNQDKIVTPTESQQIIEHDLGYTGLGVITVNAIANDYIGSSITRNTSSNVVIDGREITVRSGYYSTSVTKYVTAGLVNVPNQSATVSPSLSVSNSGLISTYINTGVPINIGVAEGYVTSGSVVSGGMTVSGSNSLQLTTKGATTFTPTTTNQTIASGTYLTGVQTIKGDSNLVAGNIKSGISIFGVTGSYSGAGVSLTSATITPSESVQTATPGTGYDGLSSVTVNAIPNNYIGSAITTRNSSDVSISGASISVPAGYYSAAVSKSVSTGSASTPATSITANPTITVSTAGLITASVTSSKSITPTVSTGYVSAGTAGTVSVTGSKTQQLSVKAAATYIPTTSNQTISSGVYLTGVQTINGDANLIAGNIKSGISIFGVTGTYSGEGVNLQTTAITATETAQTINPDSGYDGFSQVTVSAISSSYVGSNIARRSSSDLTANGATITAPAGYYSTAASKSVSAATQATPTISVSTAGVITASATQTAGYVSAGTKSTSTTLSTQAATTITPTTATQTAVASGKYTLGDVKVGPIPSDYLIPTGTKTISSNGTNIDVASYSTVTVNVTPSLTTKTITPSESVQTATPGTGYDGLSSVTVNAISSSYIGSNIPTRTSSNVSISGNSITVVSGYYSTAVTKTVSTATQATPSISVSTAGVITATATQTAGYVSAGTKTSSLSLTTVASTTITPTSATQTAVAANRYTLGAITVAGDPDLLPENILSGVSIFGVSGTVEIVTYYSSSTVPSNNLGSNGDLYFQTSGV